MVLDKKIITKSSRETKKLGFDFVKTLKKGTVVCLYGDFGSGKTTFVQGLAKGLGVKEKIISPTFIIIRSYTLSDKRKATSDKKFYHIDLYRTESVNDLRGLGLEEILSDPENVVVIEWAERMSNLMPKNRIEIRFEHSDSNSRKISFYES
ncbi:MAG: tRNA (adenosine(37)-N6)-threonylcarbamoyltransferase complex ATPase subunit type 1 TsaE [bacterium]|nr:tRNA (adenosine(37)-N6)-threonylcarbamoyltransferase complex ATPase subunit type 1 TsaE [bacterium]